jgi:hypothetical protein
MIALACSALMTAVLLVLTGGFLVLGEGWLAMAAALATVLWFLRMKGAIDDLLG